MLKRAVLTALIALNAPAFAADLEDALVAFEAGDFAEAVAQWRQLAEIGEPAAQNNLGFMYEKGLGVRADPFAAADLYRRAAQQGYVDAQVNLGVLYVTGHGVPRDLVEAHKWFDAAAQAGNAKALQDLSKVVGLMSPDEFARARSLATQPAETDGTSQPAPEPAIPATLAAADDGPVSERLPISQGWRVQIASLVTRNIASAERHRLQSQLALLTGRRLGIEEAVLPAGTFHRIQVLGLADEQAATALCRQLREQRQDCFVVPPG